MNYSKIILETKRLSLRPVKLNDIDIIYSYTSDAEHVKYMLDFPDESPIECMKFLKKSVEEWKKESPTFFVFAVLFDGRQIGEVSVYLNKKKLSEGELGWMIHRDFCQKGFATEAVKAVVNFCRNELKLENLIACCDSRNVASIRVMEKIGMNLTMNSLPRYYKKNKETAITLIYKLKLNSQ